MTNGTAAHYAVIVSGSKPQCSSAADIPAPPSATQGLRPYSTLGHLLFISNATEGRRLSWLSTHCWWLLAVTWIRIIRRPGANTLLNHYSTAST